MQFHFLIVFDGARGRMKEAVRDFPRPAAALEAYQAAEERYDGEPEVQVVLIASDSLDTVKATHPNFFGSVDLKQLVEEALKA